MGVARLPRKSGGLYRNGMDHRSSALSAPPVFTALQQMAILAKETHDAFLQAGFDRKTATDLTVGLLRR